MVRSNEQLGRQIAELLIDHGLVQTWYRSKPEGWILKSGLWSPFYINLRPLASTDSSQQLLQAIGEAMGQIIKTDIKHATKLVGTYFAGIPIATAITMKTGIPSCFARHVAEDQIAQEIEKLEHHGSHNLIEGFLKDNDRIVIVDDLVTKFNTKLFVKKLIELEVQRKNLTNVQCTDVVVLLDRGQGADVISRSHGMKLHSVISFKADMMKWLKDKLISIEYEVITDYVAHEDKYQSEKVKSKLHAIAKTQQNGALLRDIFS